MTATPDHDDKHDALLALGPMISAVIVEMDGIGCVLPSDLVASARRRADRRHAGLARASLEAAIADGMPKAEATTPAEEAMVVVWILRTATAAEDVRAQAERGPIDEAMEALSPEFVDATLARLRAFLADARGMGGSGLAEADWESPHAAAMERVLAHVGAARVAQAAVDAFGMKASVRLGAKLMRREVLTRELLDLGHGDMLGIMHELVAALPRTR